MGANDREHFEDYREQTRAKHEILAAYLPVYFRILKSREKNLLFIDGFAGRGTYTKTGTDASIDGSPLRALKLIAGNRDLTAHVGTIFIEADGILFDQLKQRVDAFYTENPSIREPACFHDTFSECVARILASVKGQLAPTFLFVDPCGVSGASFTTIRAVMECDKCEAFIFFNIDGVRRIAGLDELSDVLIELMGSQERARSLYDALRKSDDVLERERLIISHYIDAIKDVIGANYVIPFRVEHESKQSTSHYFIHATKHPLGFRIMKDVMWRRGHLDDRAGGLELAQSSRTNIIPLFDLRGDEIKAEILNALKKGPLPISVFYEEWTARPNDLLCEPAYRQSLLELEADGRIDVLSKEGTAIVGAAHRRKHKGKATLGKDYYVQLSGQ